MLSRQVGRATQKCGKTDANFDERLDRSFHHRANCAKCIQSPSIDELAKQITCIKNAVTVNLQFNRLNLVAC